MRCGPPRAGTPPTIPASISCGSSDSRVGREDGLEEWLWAPDAFDIVSDAWRTVSRWCEWIEQNLGDLLMHPSRR